VGLDVDRLAVEGRVREERTVELGSGEVGHLDALGPGPAVHDDRREVTQAVVGDGTNTSPFGLGEPDRWAAVGRSNTDGLGGRRRVSGGARTAPVGEWGGRSRRAVRLFEAVAAGQDGGHTCGSTEEAAAGERDYRLPVGFVAAAVYVS
jgi:hypothetical protein